MNASRSEKLFVAAILAILFLAACKPQEVSYNEQGQRVLRDPEPPSGLQNPGSRLDMAASRTVVEIADVSGMRHNRIYRAMDSEQGNACYVVSNGSNGTISIACVKDTP